jgi:hypothetical protein
MLSINKMSMGVSEAGALYTVYVKYDTLDCSSDDFANGEIFLQYSQDDGQSWSSPASITNSPSPNCSRGQCADDGWPSLADIVGNYLHIIYTCYTHPEDPFGPIWQGNVLYLTYPNPLTSTYSDPSVPEVFKINQNYPNPFNSSTTISFELAHSSRITLSVYNLLGQRMATLFEGIREAGQHKVVWKADGIPSGVYVARLTTADGRSRETRMLLVK